MRFRISSTQCGILAQSANGINIIGNTLQPVFRQPVGFLEAPQGLAAFCIVNPAS
jgi:allophanate hydrolase subunit 1